jgi:parvulin-like peptidyl-prolyl isomerase
MLSDFFLLCQPNFYKTEVLMKAIMLILVLVLSATFLITACGKQEEATEIEAAHILIMYVGSDRAPASVTRTKEEALKEIKDVLKQIKDGADFGEMAKAHSDGPSKVKGGMLGKFSRGSMVKPFEDAAFSLKKGKVSDVVETPFGFHIIKRVS